MANATAVPGLLTPCEVYERMLVRGQGYLLGEGGATTAVPVARWLGPVDDGDRALFVDSCRGPTLDVGCGPGRLTSALAGQGVTVLGIDTSSRAVEIARARGATVLRRDVFAATPRAGSWHHLLLADGNVGIGGDPVSLLRRVARLIRPGGRVHVELSGATGGVARSWIRLVVGGEASRPFQWATVAADAISGLGTSAGLVLDRVERSRSRWAATLVRPEEPCD